MSWSQYSKMTKIQKWRLWKYNTNACFLLSLSLFCRIKTFIFLMNTYWWKNENSTKHLLMMAKKYLLTLVCRKNQQCWIRLLTMLPIRSHCTLSLPPENIRKPYGFVVFSGGREIMHWERMGYWLTTLMLLCRLFYGFCRSFHISSQKLLFQN